MRELSICEMGAVSGGNSGAWSVNDLSNGTQVAGLGSNILTGLFTNYLYDRAKVIAAEAIFCPSDPVCGNSGGSAGGARSDGRGSTGTNGTSNGDGHGF